MTKFISPSPGRIVWYWPAPNDNIPALAGRPLAAIVAAAHSDRYINLSVIDAYGHHHSRQSVYLDQPGDEAFPDCSAGFAQWMPYQIGQAQKAEQVEKAPASAPATGTGVTVTSIDPTAIFADADGRSASEIGLVGAWPEPVDGQGAVNEADGAAPTEADAFADLLPDSPKVEQ